MASNVTEEMIEEASEIAALLMQKAGMRRTESGRVVGDPSHVRVTAAATILAAMIMAGGNPTNG